LLRLRLVVLLLVLLLQLARRAAAAAAANATVAIGRSIRHAAAIPWPCQCCRLLLQLVQCPIRPAAV
jgi:hypothetical protein